MSDDPRVTTLCISENAIRAKMVQVHKHISGVPEEKSREMAINYLCSVTEELSKYGATITWK